MKKQLLILMTLFTVAIGYSQIFTDANFIEYEIIPSTNNVQIIGYDYANGGAAVNIPATVDYNFVTYNVAYINSYAFQGNVATGEQIMSVVIPNSVTTISLGVFNYNLLSSITIPSSVTSIGSQTFANNPLTDVFSESTTPPTIVTGGTNDTFGVTARSGIHLHIPGGTMGAYVTDAGALWTGFNPVTEDALSVSDFELTNDITVITTTDEIRVTHSNNIKLQNYTIYSMSGAIVTTGKESEIPTTYLASGIYILKLDFDKGIVSKKVVIN